MGFGEDRAEGKYRVLKARGSQTPRPPGLPFQGGSKKALAKARKRERAAAEAKAESWARSEDAYDPPPPYSLYEDEWRGPERPATRAGYGYPVQQRQTSGWARSVGAVQNVLVNWTGGGQGEDGQGWGPGQGQFVEKPFEIPVRPPPVVARGNPSAAYPTPAAAAKPAPRGPYTWGASPRSTPARRPGPIPLPPGLPPLPAGQRYVIVPDPHGWGNQ